MTAVFYVFLGLFGLAVGSFLNVVIVRMPAKESILTPPSRCPQCRSELALRDNIPVVAWLLLRGKCRSCSEPIPAGYPLVELANAVLWLAAGVRFGQEWILLPYLFLFSVLLAQSVIDLELYILLDRITFPALAVSVPLLLAVSLTVDDARWAIVGAVIGSLGYFAFLGLPALLYPRGMGLGDVKLALLMGLYLGFISPILLLFALVVACFMGIVAGGILYFARGGKSENFPFGPWLALGCVVVILFSSTFLAPYQAA